MPLDLRRESCDCGPQYRPNVSAAPPPCADTKAHAGDNEPHTGTFARGRREGLSFTELCLKGKDNFVYATLGDKREEAGSASGFWLLEYFTGGRERDVSYSEKNSSGWNSTNGLSSTDRYEMCSCDGAYGSLIQVTLSEIWNNYVKRVILTLILGKFCSEELYHKNSSLKPDKKPGEVPHH